ncbi:hypothetical protein AALB39_18105 [Lachnospiraceae bacterium 54-53]
MANTIEYASIIQTELDKAAKETATSGWMELNDDLVKYNSGSEVKIPKLDMDGLGNYDRQDGFVDGDVDLTWQTKSLTQDRGRRFTFDENEVNDTNFVLTASTVMGEFQNKKVVPEIDAYRYSSIAAGAITRDHAAGGYIPAEATILSQLYYDIAAVQDVVGDDTPLVITMSIPVAAMFDLNDKLSRSVSVTEFEQGELKLKVKALNGQHPIIRVGSGRMKTSYLFRDGATAGQTMGGFAPAEDAKDVNWIICPRRAPIAVSRTDKMRIFDPETYQGKRAWAMDYRKFHDLWMLDQSWDSVKVNIKQELNG